MSSSFDSLDERLIVIHCEGEPYRIRLVFWNYDYEMSNLDILHLDLCYLSRFIFISPQITSQAGTVAAQLRVEAEVCGEARRPCSEKWILKWICHILKACSACSSKVVGSLRFLVDPKVTTRCIALPNPFFAQSFRSGNVEMINSSKERLYKEELLTLTFWSTLPFQYRSDHSGKTGLPFTELQSFTSSVPPVRPPPVRSNAWKPGAARPTPRGRGWRRSGDGNGDFLWLKTRWISLYQLTFQHFMKVSTTPDVPWKLSIQKLQANFSTTKF